MTKKFKLSAKQAEAAGILSQGGTCTFAAETVGVTPQTISEWKHNPAFEALINYMIMESLESARTKIQQASLDAVLELTELALKAENPETRRKACLDVLRLSGFEPGKNETFCWGVGQVNAGAPHH